MHIGPSFACLRPSLENKPENRANDNRQKRRQRDHRGVVHALTNRRQDLILLFYKEAAEARAIGIGDIHGRTPWTRVVLLSLPKEQEVLVVHI